MPTGGGHQGQQPQNQMAAMQAALGQYGGSNNMAGLYGSLFGGGAQQNMPQMPGGFQPPGGGQGMPPGGFQAPQLQQPQRQLYGSGLIQPAAQGMLAGAGMYGGYR
jgi:hypothetical protein